MPDNCEIIRDLPIDKNLNILKKNILLKDKDKNWFLLLEITENQEKGIIDDQNKATTIINFIGKELNLTEEKRKKLNLEKCICEKQDGPRDLTNSEGKEAYKAWYNDDAAKKEYIAYHYYILEDNSSHIIFMTDSNPRKADLICRSLSIKLNKTE